MTNVQSVESFSCEGGDHGVLVPVYYLNILSLAQRIPEGSRILDLGCGPGQFISLLSLARPDIHIVGVDLSSEMVSIAKKNISQNQLESRVEILEMDMINALDAVDSYDIVTSIFSLHHLPTFYLLEKIISKLSSQVQKRQIGFWIFDFHRPHAKRTCLRFPNIFTPHTSKPFKKDTSHSMMAAFNEEEIRKSFMNSSIIDFDHEVSRPLAFYQTVTNLKKINPGVSQDSTLTNRLGIGKQVVDISNLFINTFYLDSISASKH